MRTTFGNDMDGEQLAWSESLMVAEAPALITDPVDLAPLRSRPAPRTWVRPILAAVAADPGAERASGG